VGTFEQQPIHAPIGQKGNLNSTDVLPTLRTQLFEECFEALDPRRTLRACSGIRRPLFEPVFPRQHWFDVWLIHTRENAQTTV
jgi:hypothetical protein